MAGPPRSGSTATPSRSTSPRAGSTRRSRLCRGELLAGLDDEWVYEYRDAHRLRVSELFEALAARAEPDDRARAVALTRKRVALDPLAEDAQRALIERLGRAGDRSGALLAYSRFRERLRGELGVSASAETRALADEIREGADEPAQAPEQADRPGPGRAARPPATGLPAAPFPLPPAAAPAARARTSSAGKPSSLRCGGCGPRSARGRARGWRSWRARREWARPG